MEGEVDCCRLCAKLVQTAQLEKLFDRHNRRRLRQIEQITGLKFKKIKNLPELYCNACQCDLDHVYQFRERILDAQKHFSSEQYKNTVKEKCELNEVKLGMLEEVPVLQNEFCDVTIAAELPAVIDEHELVSEKLEILEKQNENYEISETDVETKVFKSKRKKDSTTPIKFICDQCGNYFTCRHHFVTHLRRHAGDKQFQCELCPDKFFTHSELNRHMRRHTGEKPFSCKYCERSFTDYSTRIKHERTHTNERPFSCNRCDKSFTTSYILKNHILTHTGERSFQCKLCNKSFQRQTHLVVHNRSLMHKQNETKQMSIDAVKQSVIQNTELPMEN